MFVVRAKCGRAFVVLVAIFLVASGCGSADGEDRATAAQPTLSASTAAPSGVTSTAAPLPSTTGTASTTTQAAAGSRGLGGGASSVASGDIALFIATLGPVGTGAVQRYAVVGVDPATLNVVATIPFGDEFKSGTKPFTSVQLAQRVGGQVHVVVTANGDDGEIGRAYTIDLAAGKAALRGEQSATRGKLVPYFLARGAFGSDDVIAPARSDHPVNANGSGVVRLSLDGLKEQAAQPVANSLRSDTLVVGRTNGRVFVTSTAFQSFSLHEIDPQTLVGTRVVQLWQCGGGGQVVASVLSFAPVGTRLVVGSSCTLSGKQVGELDIIDVDAPKDRYRSVAWGDYPGPRVLEPISDSLVGATDGSKYLVVVDVVKGTASTPLAPTGGSTSSCALVKTRAVSALSFSGGLTGYSATERGYQPGPAMPLPSGVNIERAITNG